MSLENMSSQECVIIFASLNYLKVLNGKQSPQIQSVNSVENKLPRPEKPHRPEPVRRPRKPPKYTLADLLAQESEDDESGEWDTGGPVGNEIW